MIFSSTIAIILYETRLDAQDTRNVSGDTILSEDLTFLPRHLSYNKRSPLPFPLYLIAS